MGSRGWGRKSQVRPRTATSTRAIARPLTSQPTLAGADRPSGAPPRARAVSSCSACARVVPQWQAGARLGTRRLQFGHVHVTEAIDRYPSQFRGGAELERTTRAERRNRCTMAVHGACAAGPPSEPRRDALPRLRPAGRAVARPVPLYRGRAHPAAPPRAVPALLRRGARRGRPAGRPASRDRRPRGRRPGAPPRGRARARLPGQRGLRPPPRGAAAGFCGSPAPRGGPRRLRLPGGAGPSRPRAAGLPGGGGRGGRSPRRGIRDRRAPREPRGRLPVVRGRLPGARGVAPGPHLRRARHVALRRARAIRPDPKALRHSIRRDQRRRRLRRPPGAGGRPGGAHGGLLPRGRALDRVPGAVPPARLRTGSPRGPHPVRSLRTGDLRGGAARGRRRGAALPRRAGRAGRGPGRSPRVGPGGGPGPHRPPLRPSGGGPGGRGRHGGGGGARPGPPGPHPGRRCGRLLEPRSGELRRPELVRGLALLHLLEGGLPARRTAAALRAVEHRSRERRELRRACVWSRARPRVGPERRRMRTFVTVAAGVLGTLALAGPIRAAETIRQAEGAAKPVALVGGAPITEAEVDRAAEGQLRELRMREFTLRSQALEELIAQKLLEKEAAARGVALPALVKAEVEDKAAVSEAEVRALYQSNKDKMGAMSEADALKQIESRLRPQRERERRASYVRELRQKAGEAAGCAGEQGKFWEMHDRLFANQAKLQVPDLKEHAAVLGLDPEAFRQCLDSGRHTADLQRDAEAGIGYGVSGTPSFFINGRPLVGAQPFESFAQVIDDELERVPKAR